MPGLDLSSKSTSLRFLARSSPKTALTSRLVALKPAATSAKRGRPPKIKAPLSQYKGTSQGPNTASVNKLRDDSGQGARSPSTGSESSSEDSDSESEYEEEDEMPLIDIATVSIPFT